MNLDIRLPIGLMFTLLGILLVIYGFLTRYDANVYQRALNINVNLWWGGVLIIFGMTLLFLSRKK